MTGSDAQECRVCPPIRLAATPEVAVFASFDSAFQYLNVSEIAFINNVLPVPALTEHHHQQLWRLMTRKRGFKVILDHVVRAELLFIKHL